MTTLKIRRDLIEQYQNIPHAHGFILKDITYTAWQPEELEDEEYNTILKDPNNGEMFLVNSIDLEQFNKRKKTMAINGIEVTDVIIFPTKIKKNDTALKASARIVINNQFTIKGIKIFKGRDGAFIQYPQDYIHISAELREYFRETILSQYEAAK